VYFRLLKNCRGFPEMLLTGLRGKPFIVQGHCPELKVNRVSPEPTTQTSGQYANISGLEG
jgi:hypothetical protein